MLAWAALPCAALAFALLAGCTTHQCDPSTADFYGGLALDDNTFVTSRWVDDRWIPYDGGETLTVWFPRQFAGRTPKIPQAMLGTDATPNGGDAFSDGDNFTLVAGQLVLYNDLNTDLKTVDAGTFGGSFTVTNGSCASYFARFEVDFVPVGADAGSD
jgi:hypothetical protein